MTLFAALNASALEGQAALLEPLRNAAMQAAAEFNQIPPARQENLNKISQFVRERTRAGKSVDLNFICTHNSRRSHLAQLWAQVAAAYYGLSNVNTFSGGTDATAFNIRTVRALRRAGFSIAEAEKGTNPVYLVQYSEGQPPLRMFSKKFTDPPNPREDFAALFACDDAAEKCPVVNGAVLRLPLSYVDPKVSDNTPAEAATYDERSRQIAREMFFVMSKAAGAIPARAAR